MRNWLKQLREKKKLTMKCIAEKLGISESYYCSIENGIRQKRMDIVLISGIAEAVGISIAEAVEYEKQYSSNGEGGEVQ